MAQNKMEEVAKLLGLELEEEFRIKYDNKAMYVLKDDGFFEVVGRNTYLQRDIDNLLNGEWEVVKLPKPILDDGERKDLGNIVKPFRDRMIYIEKAETIKTYNPNAKVYECIYIMYKDSSKKQNPFYMGFPCFKKGTMYKGMELNKKYTLEELGL